MKPKRTKPAVASVVGTATRLVGFLLLGEETSPAAYLTQIVKSMKSA